MKAIDKHFDSLFKEESIAIATDLHRKRLPKSDKRALVDVPPNDREHVMKKWSLRAAIIDARATFKMLKRLKREASKKRNKSVAPEA